MQQLDRGKYLMVICKDKPEDPIDYGYTLYFVNNTEENIECLRIKQESIVRDFDEETEISKYEKEILSLEPKSYNIIENIDEMDLPFNLSFDAYIKTKDAESKRLFDFKQLYELNMEVINIPVLNKEGYVLAAS